MEKSKDSYKTISEVAQEIGLENKNNKKPSTHTLRFWEKHFKKIKPKILSGNRRYYSKKDIDYLKLIYIAKNKGLTINGAKALNDPSLKLDDALFSVVNNKNLSNSLKIRAEIRDIVKNKKYKQWQKKVQLKRLVPEKPDSPFYYYVKNHQRRKAKVKLKLKIQP